MQENHHEQPRRTRVGRAENGFATYESNIYLFTLVTRLQSCLTQDVLSIRERENSYLLYFIFDQI